MPANLTLDQARAILADDVLGPPEVADAFGTSAVSALEMPVPFTRAELTAARAAGEMLVLRVPQAGVGVALTTLHMVQRSPDAFDPKLLRKMGYQLKDEWGIESEPSAAVDTCAPGWALVTKTILDASRNHSYDEQKACLAQHAQRVGVAPSKVRRRTGVEVVYDTVLYYTARRERLLETAWDWSSTPTVDGGYLNVGGFGPAGLQVLSFSRAVRHGGLGICPTRQAAR